MGVVTAGLKCPLSADGLVATGWAAKISSSAACLQVTARGPFGVLLLDELNSTRGAVFPANALTQRGCSCEDGRGQGVADGARQPLGGE
jgi:hypothetical protein